MQKALLFLKNKESEGKVKILESRLFELNDTLEQVKLSYENETNSLINKLQDFQNEKTELLAKIQIYSSKFENFEEEKLKIEEKYQEKIRENEEEKSQIIEELKDKNSQLAEYLKKKEEQFFNSTKKLEKINALMEQKMQMDDTFLKEVKEERDVNEKN